MAKDYIQPAFQKRSFTCPHCGTLSLMDYCGLCYMRGEKPFIQNGNTPVGGGVNRVLIATCCNCQKKIIWIDDEYVYPDIVAEEANSDMPDTVKQLYEEAGLIYNNIINHQELLVHYFVWQLIGCATNLEKLIGISTRILGL